MANNTSAININVDSNVKKEATELFNSLGLNMSTAINLFLRKSINEGGIPFEIKNPKPTRKLKMALKEAKKIENGEIKSKGYHNVEELFEDLNNWVLKQNKDLNKLKSIAKSLANGDILEEKYKDHNLVNDKYFEDCRECHIEPDWLLIYKYTGDKLILLLVETGSHSELFKKYNY